MPLRRISPKCEERAVSKFDVSEFLKRAPNVVLTTQELADYWGVSRRFIESARAAGTLGIPWRKRGRELICDKTDADRVLPGGAKAWCTPEVAAAITGYSKRTLEKRRAEGREEAEWICLGRRLIRYRVAALCRKKSSHRSSTT